MEVRDNNTTIDWEGHSRFDQVVREDREYRQKHPTRRQQKQRERRRKRKKAA